MTWETFFLKNKIILITVVFIVFQVEGYRNIMKLNCRTAEHLLLPHLKLFHKTKIGLELVPLLHFLHHFRIKIFLLLYSITWTNFDIWLPLFLQILDNMYIVIVCLPGCDVINFEINLIFLTKMLFLHDQKGKTKILISWEQKELLRWNKKHFSLFFEGKPFTAANKVLFKVRFGI